MLSEHGEFVARLGCLKLQTGIVNVTGAHITRNYPASFVDDGLTFGTNHDAGVCVHFGEKVPSPLRRQGHSAPTVTVADLEGLVVALGGDPADPSAAP
jgi:hypothetical protein